MQAEFTSLMGEVIAEDPQFRAATVFQLFDRSPDLAGQLAAPLKEDSNSEIAVLGERFEAWPTTVGLCRWEDGTCRDGWEAFLDAAAEAREARP